MVQHILRKRTLRINASTFLTLLASFSLSTVAFIAAQPIPVQHYDFEQPMIIQPRVETLEFDEFFIEAGTIYVEFDEETLVIAQHDNTDADYAGIDWENNYEFWCAIHPDECQKADDDEDGGSDEEEGC